MLKPGECRPDDAPDRRGGLAAPNRIWDRTDRSRLHNQANTRELIMALLISVAPAGEGWTIHSDDFAEDLFFQSGGRAEAAARALADRNAEQGRAAEVQIFLRDGALAGVVSYPSRFADNALAG
jgi:hypothetical protein